MHLKGDYKENKNLLYAVMRNKIKPKSALCSILEKDGNLASTEDTYLNTQIEYFKDLLITVRRVQKIKGLQKMAIHHTWHK